MNLIRIDKLFNFEKGSLQSSKSVPGAYHFLTASAQWKTHNEYTYDTEALVFAAAAAGSLGRTHYIKDKFIASDLCFVLSPKDPSNLPVDLQFYHIIFNSLRDDIVKNTKSGTSKEAIGLASFGKYEIPYISINKQIEIKKQIVKAVELKEQLTTDFALQTDLLKKLRQQIFQDAVQGKLVPQDPNDEPACLLLERIKAEKQKLITEGKIKKEKPLPPIKPEEIPFEIPENWVWCRLGEVVNFLNGYAFKSEWFAPVGIRLLRNINLGVKEIIWDSIAYLSLTKAAEFNEFLLNNGDIVLSLDRPIINSGLKIAQVKEKDRPCILLQRVLKIMPLLLNSDFLFNWFNSKSFIESINPGRSIGIPHVSHNDVSKIIFPLPPITEQFRLVNKIEQLMKLCDELEQTIQQNQKYTRELLQVALKEALEPKGD